MLAVVAVVLLLLAALYRLLGTFDLALSNVSPLMAIAFCGAVYFRNRWMWLVPFAALGLSDVYINHFYAVQYGFHWSLGGLAARTACFAFALLLGAWVKRRKSWLWLRALARARSLGKFSRWYGRRPKATPSDGNSTRRLQGPTP